MAHQHAEPLVDLLFHQSRALEDLLAAVDHRARRASRSPRSRRSACGSPRSACVDLREAGRVLARMLTARRHSALASSRPAFSRTSVAGSSASQTTTMSWPQRCSSAHAGRRRLRRVHEQAHRRGAVASRFVGFGERRLQRAGAAGLGLDDDARAGGGGVGPERRRRSRRPCSAGSRRPSRRPRRTRRRRPGTARCNCSPTSARTRCRAPSSAALHRAA